MGDHKKTTWKRTNTMPIMQKPILEQKKRGTKMKCPSCDEAELLMSIDGLIFVGSGNIRTHYFCPWCAEEFDKQQLVDAYNKLVEDQAKSAEETKK